MTNRSSFRQHILYKIFLWLALAVSLLFLWQINSSILSNTQYIPVDDFSHYWAAGRLNGQGANPYDPAEVQQLRDTLTGIPAHFDTVPINWAPPWSLFILMPYGLLPYPLSRLVWLITQVTIILICANLTWTMYGGKGNTRFFAWIIAFIFAPTISVLEKGQITPFVLLGIVGFLYFISINKNPWLAGLCLVPISLKPQLFFLFWPAVLLWIIKSKEWRIVAAAFFGLVITVLIPSIWNPDVLLEYSYAILHYPPTDWATPTIGGYLRLFFGIEKFWLQFIPPILGFLWLLFYWWKNRTDWDWTETLPYLLFSSILTSPYAWTYDQVILLPAILIAGILVRGPVRKFPVNVVWITYVVINLLDLVLHRYFDEFWFGWLAPAYFLWFIWSTKVSRENKPRQL